MVKNGDGSIMLSSCFSIVRAELPIMDSSKYQSILAQNLQAFVRQMIKPSSMIKYKAQIKVNKGMASEEESNVF